jgi:hypothetical protein
MGGEITVCTPTTRWEIGTWVHLRASKRDEPSDLRRRKGEGVVTPDTVPGYVTWETRAARRPITERVGQALHVGLRRWRYVG